ncbi:MAG: DNA topoisomerase [Halobacteriaceae archaeon]
MDLIITEKGNVARRIADILSDGSHHVEDRNGVSVYRWDDTHCIGLSGHVVGIDFPEEYADWRDAEPAELVDAPVVTRPTREDIVAVLESLAADADRVVVATDYDREGELIGKEALDLVRAVNPDVPADRARFSSITENEVREAFAEPEHLDEDLAAAGEARQIIDLVWGAALTRFLSLVARRRGEDFISVGRVQSPTLKLIVDREREIDAFEPEDYWELFAELARNGESFEAQYFYDEDGSEAERVDAEAAADAVLAVLAAADEATVDEVRRRTRTDDPPVPFDTTAFISAAGSLGYGASDAMSVAEDLYTAGHITYPRTDNTVYPDDLDPAELLAALAEEPAFGDDAESLLAAEELSPTRGDEETTDHPPIHPTADLPDRADLDDREWELYELVVRRFFATVADPARWEHLRVVAAVEGLDPAAADGTATLDAAGVDPDDLPGAGALKANGRRLVEPGYHAVYPYHSTSENYVPDVSEGETLSLADPRSEAKQTQPPRRYGQARLVETMADMGIGTKSTRHNTVEKLYDRGYVEGDPPRPTTLARAVVTAAEEYADLVVSEEMTSHLEAEMTAIAEGEKDLDEVTEESREALERVFAELEESREDVAELLQASLRAQRVLGPCPESDHELVVRESNRGDYFVGCEGYPDCDYTLPLPSGGEPKLLDETCDEHGLRHVRIEAGRNSFVHGCPLCAREGAGVEHVLDEGTGSCPDCGAAEGGDLAVKRLENGSRLVGCTRYPDCEYSLPFPRHGSVVETGERCGDHDLPELEIHQDGEEEPWDFGCPVCNYVAYRARQDVRELDGVGDAIAGRLADAGVETIGDLLDVEDPDALADEVEGVSAERLADWQSAAAEA